MATSIAADIFNHHNYEPLQYTPFADSTKSIRVLQIKPCETTTSILECTLIQVRLTSKYVCLSYMWGTDNASHPVLINGQLLYVRDNLYAFLQQARKSLTDSAAIPVWIDAVCINQDDLAERNAQVAMMGDIYRGAFQVVIWLGCGDARLGRAMEFVIKVGALYSTICARQYGFDLNDRSWPVAPDVILQALEIAAGTAESGSELTSAEVWERCSMILEAFVSLRYWSRMWTVQEIVLASNVKICYGEKIVPEAWFQIILYVVQHMPMASKELGPGDPTRSPCCVSLKLREEVSRSGGVQVNMFHMLRKFRGHECTMPQDKIYALRALASDGSAIPVDYAGSGGMLLDALFRQSSPQCPAIDGAYLVKTLGMKHNDLELQLKAFPIPQKWQETPLDIGVFRQDEQDRDIWYIDGALVKRSLAAMQSEASLKCKLFNNARSRHDHDTIAESGDIVAQVQGLGIFIVFKGPESIRTLPDWANTSMVNTFLSTCSFRNIYHLHEKSTYTARPCEYRLPRGASNKTPMLLEQAELMLVEEARKFLHLANTSSGWKMVLNWQCLLSLWDLTIHRPWLLVEDNVGAEAKEEWEDAIAKAKTDRPARRILNEPPRR
ncbi:hypothetical protein LTS08_002929 [Lithohypha guttulata]|nr:hypothetical protein LTS08_002929 [Lithohypha guttulata]